MRVRVRVRWCVCGGACVRVREYECRFDSGADGYQAHVAGEQVSCARIEITNEEQARRAGIALGAPLPRKPIPRALPLEVSSPATATARRPRRRYARPGARVGQHVAAARERRILHHPRAQVAVGPLHGAPTPIVGRERLHPTAPGPVLGQFDAVVDIVASGHAVAGGGIALVPCAVASQAVGRAAGPEVGQQGHGLCAYDETLPPVAVTLFFCAVVVAIGAVASFSALQIWCTAVRGGCM